MRTTLFITRHIVKKRKQHLSKNFPSSLQVMTSFSKSISASSGGGVFSATGWTSMTFGDFLQQVFLHFMNRTKHKIEAEIWSFSFLWYIAEPKMAEEVIRAPRRTSTKSLYVSNDTLGSEASGRLSWMMVRNTATASNTVTEKPILSPDSSGRMKTMICRKLIRQMGRIRPAM